MKTGRLSYNSATQRYGILIFDLWENDGLHCGQTLDVFVNGEWINDRLEITHDKWYLVHSRLAGCELEYLQVRI